MIGISKLYCGTVEPSDALRYGRHSGKMPSHLLQFSEDKKPVVVWNVTRRCNLKCIHCYAHARDIPYENELSTQEARNLIDDLANMGVPVLLFSGGEPLLRKDLPELARGKGNKIIGIPPARFKSGDECMTAAIAAPESTAILVQCGQRTMTLKPRDLEKYAGSRGRRGTLLPRGWRKVDALAVQADT